MLRRQPRFSLRRYVTVILVSPSMCGPEGRAGEGSLNEFVTGLATISLGTPISRLAPSHTSRNPYAKCPIFCFFVLKYFRE